MNLSDIVADTQAMTDTKTTTRWLVNIIAFVLLAVLIVTGLLNWLLIPRGFEGGAGPLLSLRHGLRAIHQAGAILFMAIIAVHLWLHRSHITTQIRKIRAGTTSPKS